MKNMTHVGFDGTGGVTLDVVSTQQAPAADVVRWAESLAARARLAESQGLERVQYDVACRLPLTPEAARILATDLNDRADEHERINATSDLIDATYDRIRDEGKN